MEIICYIKKKGEKFNFPKRKNSSNVTLFTLSRRVKAGRKFARPQPLCRIFDRAFRPASSDKTVPAGTKILPASIFASAPFVIDIIVIFSINLVLPSTRYSSATRVSSSMNWGGGFPWGKGWRERERERGGTKREGEKEGRKEIRERTSEDSYFPSRWMKRRGAGGVREWLKVYPKRQVGDHCLDESTKKLLFHPCILGSSSVNRHLSQRSPIHIPGNNRTTRDSY